MIQQVFNLVVILIIISIVLKLFMSTIFNFHNHSYRQGPKGKQHPIRRLLYATLLVLTATIPFNSAKVFAEYNDITAHLYIDGESYSVITSAKNVSGAIKEAGFKVGDNDLVEPGLDTEIMDGFKINVYRALPVTIKDSAVAGGSLEVETAQKTGEGIAKDAGVEVFAEDLLSVRRNDIDINELKPGLVLEIDRAEVVSLNLYGALSEQRTQAGTVEEFLTEKNLALQEGDSLVNNIDEAIVSGSYIEIVNNRREVQVVDEEIAMPVTSIKDVNKNKGYKEVTKLGSPGLKRITYEIAKENGIEVGRTVLEEVVLQDAIEQVQIIGAKIVTPTSSVSGSREDWLRAAGVAESNWGYVDYILQKESGWNYTARNRSSGAYGLCQSLPGNKMASAGSDWQSNPVTQLKWCNQYAHSRYGSWAAAYSFWQNKHWW